ncbi:MAG: DNA methyltransferase [Armatimonadetes bacterium]|nr:DNA methyltransferase [Armatimonadota bacterium]NIM23123.1 DNA methyltransferase [Armatimonadota bacterium]NIM66991.1 DNA methyltransferase [Armatimonadota bacterium]NIM75525.1 DNA methyltransferase [Armatimonadota bacterium]NIN05180.1 DNA methyltransferase [Armatimonadota bacterium]
MTRNRANNLDGATWARHSISVWSDIRKTPEETVLHHPAMFPIALATRLIECFTTAKERVVLDPFAGIGSAPLAAALLGGKGIGLDISSKFVSVARRRLNEINGPEAKSETVFHCGDARNLSDYIDPCSIDLVVTSPPYWDILLRRRSADRKPTRHYGKAARDLGKILDYTLFLESLKEIFTQVYETLKPGKYCCVIVMDLRKKDVFYPLHADLAEEMKDIGFIYDDMVIWDRRHEYNNLRPLGFPSVFRINKTHEFILIFRKPKVMKGR